MQCISVGAAVKLGLSVILLVHMFSAPEARSWHARLPFYYGWVIVWVGFTASVFSFGLSLAAGLLAVPMGDELQWSRSAMFFAISLRGWIGIVITPLIGPYLDRPNGVRVLSLAGGALNVASLLLIPFMDSEWQFIALFGVLGGIAQTAQGGISAATVPKWFVERRGLAVSISTLGGGVAAVFLPALVSFFTGTAGWRASWLAIAVLAFVAGTLPAFLLYRQPEDLALLPDGRRAPERSSRAEASRFEEPSYTRAEAVRSSAFWVLMFGISVGSLASNGIPILLAPIFVDRGFSFEVGATALIAYGIASTLTKFVFGWLVNRFSFSRVLHFLNIYGTLALGSILVLPSLVSPVAYAFIIGLYIGAFFPMSQMVWAEYFGRAHVGAISSLGRPLPALVASGGPFVLAFTRDLTGSYDLGLLLNALSAIICFASLFFVRPIRRSAART
jgi:MFS transporter, OFA family, oxalate/formate antiporter